MFKDLAKRTFLDKFWLKKKFSFLFNWRSNFYFFIFVTVIGTVFFGWMLLENSLTEMVNWDYTHQFIPLYYHNYDLWKSFFSTGQFVLYDTDIFVGLDNIGANSFYSLFDPFVIILVIFPRDLVPNMTGLFTGIKLAIGAVAMVKYLEYMGISKISSRIGAMCYTFCGWMIFMSGFPSYTSVIPYIPIILLGIEKVIREQKVLCLICGLFLLGITNFFFLVCICIWGVIYSCWRFFSTFKDRKGNWKKHLEVLLKGVACFACGLGLCAFTLLPSLRNSSLSGRANSIGHAYLDYIKASLKSHDLKTFFFLVFEEVGDNPGRELMAATSFFFPNEGFLHLSLIIPNTTGTPYDAWTSSIFVYTPCIIGLFIAILNSIRLKKIHHIFAVLFCVFLLFTNFSYFMFYAFSGNGYGRWFIVLIPIIVYYAIWGLDHIKEEPLWFPIAAGLMALVSTIITFFSIKWLLVGKTFSNPNNLTYWFSSYTFDSGKFKIDANYYLWSQIVFIIIYSCFYLFLRRKKWLGYIVFILTTAEIVVVGVHTSDQMSLYSYEKWFMGGETALYTAVNINDQIKAQDNTHFKLYSDMAGSRKVWGHATGANNTATFHSLMNFQVEDFAFGNKMKNRVTTSTSYNGAAISNPSWASFYSHKRFFLDNAIGFKYYIIENNSYSKRKARTGIDTWVTPNVPFYAIEMPEISPDKDRYKVFKVPDEYMFRVGHAVDSNQLYWLKKSKDKPNVNGFISTNSYYKDSNLVNYYEFQRFQYVESFGAIFDDDAIVPSNYDVKSQAPGCANSSQLITNYNIPASFYNSSNVTITEYRTGKNSTGDTLYPASSGVGGEKDVNYFFNEKNCEFVKNITSNTQGKVAYSHYVFTPKGKATFNEEDECYIEFTFPDSVPNCPIVMLFDENNNLISYEENGMKGAFDVGYNYIGGVGGTFGLYAKSKVAKVVVTHTGKTGDNYSPYIKNCLFFAYEGSSIRNYISKWKDEELQNVTQHQNSYGFETNYTEDRIVTTQIGYDSGWAISARDESGKELNVRVYRLDGGLVGFNAPKGKIKYVLYYKTPYLKEGKLLFAIAAVGTVGLVAYPFVIKLIKRRKKKEVNNEATS